MLHPTRMIRFALLGVACAAISLPAMAMDLTTARRGGLVAETQQGFVKPVDAATQALAAEINAKRQTEYTRISRENGQSVAVVGTVAAKQIIQNLPAGSLYEAPDGQILKR